MQLKGHELRLSEKGSGANADSFERIRAKLDQLHSLPYHDVRATRSYATSSSSSTHGVSCKPLPAGSERWIAAEALLREIQHNPEAIIILATPDVSKRQKRQLSGSHSSGAWPAGAGG